MTSPSTDRRFGQGASIAQKAPCRLATTGSNITLSGTQTIDGVATVADDRILVKDQTDSTENGIYSADTGDWTRTTDFDGQYDATGGTLVLVNQGTVNSHTGWMVFADGAIVIGTDDVVFTAVVPPSTWNSSAIVYNPSGTGAVATTVQTKLRLYKSITDYGADTANSAALNTTYIQAAITANYGKCLLIPGGTFSVATTGSTTAPVGDALSITSPITLIFEGVLAGTNNCNVLHINAGSSDVVSLLYEGGGIQGYGTFFETTNGNGALVKVSGGIPRIYQIKLIDAPQYSVYANSVNDGEVCEAELIGGKATYPGGGDNNYGICLVDASAGWKIDGVKSLTNASGGKPSVAIASVTLTAGTADRTQIKNCRLFAQWAKGTYIFGADIQINDNWIYNNPNGEGIRKIGASGQVNGNIIKSCIGGGITLYDGAGDECIGNQITGYEGNGILLAYYLTSAPTTQSIARALISNNRIIGKTSGTNLVEAISIRGVSGTATTENGIGVVGNFIQTAAYDGSNDRGAIRWLPNNAATHFRQCRTENNTIDTCGSYGVHFAAGTYSYHRLRGNKVIDPGMAHVALGGNRAAYRWDASVTWTGQDIVANEAMSASGTSGMDYGFSNNTQANVQSTLFAENHSRGHVTAGYLNLDHVTNSPFSNRSADSDAPDSATITATGAISNTATLRYTVRGNEVSLHFPANRPNGASSATAITYTGLPANIYPITTFYHPIAVVTDNGADQAVNGAITITTAGAITVYKTSSLASFTSSASATGHYGFTVTYLRAGV